MSVFTVVTRSGKTKRRDVKMTSVICATATALSHLPWKGHLCKTALSERRNGLWISHFSFTISLHKEHLSFLRWKRALGRGKCAYVYWPRVRLASNQIFLLLLQYIHFSPSFLWAFFLAFKRASDIPSARCTKQHRPSVSAFSQTVKYWIENYYTDYSILHMSILHWHLKTEPNNCKTWLK